VLFRTNFGEIKGARGWVLVAAVTIGYGTNLMAVKFVHKNPDTFLDSSASPAPQVLRFFAWLIFFLSRAVSAYYLFVLHPPQSFFHRANYANAGHPPGIFHPPGGFFYYNFLHWVDPSWNVAIFTQLVVYSLITILVYLIARRLYDEITAFIALALCSIWYPYLDFASYFLSENPYAFALLLSMWLQIVSLTSRSNRRVWCFGLAAGISWGVAFSLKTSVLGSVLLLWAVLCLYYWRHRQQRIITSIWVGILGMMFIITPLSYRCTKVNDGKFCLGAANFSGCMLLGHFGDVATIEWTNPDSGDIKSLSNLTNMDRGSERIVNLDFWFSESSRNLKLAWSWTKQHPFQSLWDSLSSVGYLFSWDVSYPTRYTWFRPIASAYMKIFTFIILLPACAYLFRRRSAIFSLNSSSIAEALLAAPVLGLMGTVFLVNVTEIRYRIPFDGLMIILAARFYANLLLLKSTREASKAGKKTGNKLKLMK